MASEFGRCKQCRRAVLELHCLGDRAKAVGRRMAARPEHGQRFGGKPRLDHGAQRAVMLFAVAEQLRRIEHGDAAMATLDQVLHGPVCAAAVVDGHDVETRKRNVGEHQDRISRLPDGPDMFQPLVVGRIDQDAVDLARAEHFQRASFLGGVMVAGSQHQRIAALRELLLEKPRDQGQRRVHDVGQHQPDRPGFAADQRLRNGVGQIVQAARRRLDAVARLLGDTRTAAQAPARRCSPNSRWRRRYPSGGDGTFCKRGLAGLF